MRTQPSHDSLFTPTISYEYVTVLTTHKRAEGFIKWCKSKSPWRSTGKYILNYLIGFKVLMLGFNVSEILSFASYCAVLFWLVSHINRWLSSGSVIGSGNNDLEISCVTSSTSSRVNEPIPLFWPVMVYKLFTSNFVTLYLDDWHISSVLSILWTENRHWLKSEVYICTTQSIYR